MMSWGLMNRTCAQYAGKASLRQMRNAVSSVNKSKSNLSDHGLEQ